MFRKAGAKSWTYSWTKGKTEYVIKNLKNNGLYEFQFAAYKKNSLGKWERGDYSKTSYRYYYKAVLTKVTPAKKAVKLSWKRNKSAAGYQIEYATNYNMKNSKKIKINSNSKTSYTIKGLKKGKKYYFRVHATKKKGGKTYIGEYSKRKGVKVK
ncbi:MAG: fibronectin type III domain-containing protein [Eubacterium sp.]|nr:fibronectin type III domain-containing protein [Eubacterium sp.]